MFDIPAIYMAVKKENAEIIKLLLMNRKFNLNIPYKILMI